MNDAPKSIYLPPYLTDSRSGDAMFFNLDMAKNPFLVPCWEMPEQLSRGLSPQQAAEAHARACAAVGALHITAVKFLDLCTVREATAQNYGIPPEQFVEIGAAPTARRRPTRRAYSEAQEQVLIPVPIPLDGSAPMPTEPTTTISQSSASGERRRRAVADTMGAAG